MIPLFDSALHVQKVLNEAQVQFCFIGGLALLRWGEIRNTNDVDLTILCGFGNEDSIIDLLLENFQSRISDAKEFATLNRILLLTDINNVPIDASLSGLDYESEMIERSSKYSFTPEHELQICSAEDLVILKAFANRGRDWEDIRGILLKPTQLDKYLIINSLELLCQLKEDETIVPKLQKLLAMHA